MRVYSSLLILKEIMEAIKRYEKSDLDEQMRGPVESSYYPLALHKADIWLPCHYFDYIGGTGSGGLIAIMLGRLRMNVHDSILAFEALLNEVFAYKRWFHSRSLLYWPRAKFDHQILEQAIRNLVSHHAPGVPSLRSSDFAFNDNQCRTIVLAFRRDERSRKRQGTPYLFRTYDKFPTRHRFGGNLVLAHDIPVLQVARATTASPTYFEPAIIDESQYVSGSFGLKNPCKEICDDISNMTGSTVDIILSIGTEEHRNNSAYSFLETRPGYNRLGVDALGQMKIDEWQSGGPVRKHIGSSIRRHRSKETATTLGQRPQTMIAHPDQSSVPNIKNAKINIAEWFRPRNVTVESIRKQTRDYLAREDVQSAISKIAKYLVEKRRHRVDSDLERWQRFCYEKWYQCKVPGCLEPEVEYTTRSSFRIHILDKHSDRHSMRDQVALEAALDEGRIRSF